MAELFFVTSEDFPSPRHIRIAAEATMSMRPHHRTFLFVLIGLLVLAGAGLVLTSEWEARVTPVAKRAPGVGASPVDMSPLQTARALAPLAATPEEHALARDALRLADHEIDLSFAAALYQAASLPPPSDPQLRALQARMEAAEKRVTEGQAEVAHLTQQFAAGRESDKAAVPQQLELAKARLELSQDELDDAKED